MLRDVHDQVANVYYDTGRFDKAAEHLARALEVERERLGPEAPETLELSVRYANALADLASYGTPSEDLDRKGVAEKRGEAEAVLRKTAEVMERTRTGDDRATLRVLNDLGTVLYDEGKLIEALRVLDDVLERRQRLFGPTDDDTLSTMSNLGRVYQARGDLEKAETFFRNCYEARAKKNKDDPLVYGSLTNYVTTLKERGKLLEAAPLYRKLYDLERSVFGNKSRQTMTTANNFAGILRKLKEYKEAEEIYRLDLASRKAIHGDTSYYAALGAHNLARLLLDCGKTAEALLLLEKAVSDTAAVPPEKLPPEGEEVLAKFRISYGRALAAVGRQDEARMQFASAQKHPTVREAADAELKGLGEAAVEAKDTQRPASHEVPGAP